MSKSQLEGFFPASLYNHTPLYTKENPQGELITKQSDAEACDINNIIYQFTKTGQINHINEQAASYTDLPNQLDYQESLNILQQAQEAFETLPALMRKKYDNDPALFLEALQNPDEREYLTEMGVFQRPPSPPPEASPRPAGAAGEAAGSTPAAERL